MNKEYTSKHLIIIAGIGSASESEEVFEKMVLEGLNIVRVNMSHGTHEEHHRQIEMVRSVSSRLRRNIGIFVDLSGPKIRIGEMNKETYLVENELVTLTTNVLVGDANVISVSHSALPMEVEVGNVILLSDGKKQLEVIATNKKDEIQCRVVVGGLVTSRRGVNTPGIRRETPAITDKDKADLAFAIEHQADLIGMSFVRKPEDVTEFRSMVRTMGSSANIICKLETVEAVERLESIINVSDAIMVARGDLALEVGMEFVPALQKRMIRIARSFGKPSIVATQMLDSMERGPIPTRAEVSDIATAVYDGADAIMLSGETAFGKFPVECVSVVSRVAYATEAEIARERNQEYPSSEQRDSRRNIFSFGRLIGV